MYFLDAEEPVRFVLTSQALKVVLLFTIFDVLYRYVLINVYNLFIIFRRLGLNHYVYMDCF